MASIADKLRADMLKFIVLMLKFTAKVVRTQQVLYISCINKNK